MGHRKPQPKHGFREVSCVETNNEAVDPPRQKLNLDVGPSEQEVPSPRHVAGMFFCALKMRKSKMGSHPHHDNIHPASLKGLKEASY